MVNLPLPFRKEVQGLLKRGWLIWNFMVISFDSVTFSSSFKSLNHLSDKDRGTMAPGFKSCLAMISLRSVNFSALLFLASLPYILENCCLYYEIELQIFRSFLRYLHKVFRMFLKKLYFMCVSSCLILARPKQKWEFLWLPLFTQEYSPAFIVLLHLSASKYNAEPKEQMQKKVLWMLDEETSFL